MSDLEERISRISSALRNECLSPTNGGAIAVAAMLEDIRDELQMIREMMEEERAERYESRAAMD